MSNALIPTADFCDQHEGDENLQVAAPIFRHFGGKAAFAGQIVTLKVFEDNALVRVILGTDGTGKVLVVDGGGSLRCALVGDQLGLLAQNNGWQGVVVNGCVRDTAELARQNIGVCALAAHPKRSIKKGEGVRDHPLHFAEVTFKPGDWLLADKDGIVVLSK